MLFLESFVHRDRLAQIIKRWMINRPEPGDTRELKQIINFNTYMSRIWLDRVGRNILDRFHGAPVRWVPIREKGQLKDFVVDHLTYTNKRIEEICNHYRTYPEDYYRETPIDGGMYLLDIGTTERLIALSRLKRFRRVGEKGSRRIVDFILSRIRANATALAEERARLLGVRREQLLSSPDTMVSEFAHAERRLIKSIKRGTIETDLPLLSIPDVAGLKVIIEEHEHNRLLDAIEATGTCVVMEAEHHSGVYSAINLKVAHKIPWDELFARPPAGHALRLLKYRGFDPDTVEREYHDFLSTAEDTVYLEIIVSTFQNFVESELGRSMHEDRVLTQRAHREYNGPVATNVRYLIDFILSLCRSPTMSEIRDVPIKLWVKYMPDYMEHLIRMQFRSQDVYLEMFAEDEDVYVSQSGATPQDTETNRPGSS